jgi:hypothetical protein
VTQAYREAFGKRDFDAVAPTLADDVLLLAPDEVEPLRGRERVMWIVRAAVGVLADWRLVTAIEGDEVDAVRYAARLPDGGEFEVVQLVTKTPDGLVGQIKGFARPMQTVARWGEIVNPGKPPGAG